MGHFYEQYLRTGSIEHAYKFANAFANDRLAAVLSHRAGAADAEPRVVVHPSLHHDPIYVDISAAKETIARLGIPPDRFISIMSRKLRIHHWIFEGEREGAILPIGGYFARFSWKNAKDVVHCHWVYKPRMDLPLATCQTLSDLIVFYNDVYESPYRRHSKPVSLQEPHLFRTGLAKLHQLMGRFLTDEQNYGVLEAIRPVTARMLRATCHSNLSMADEKIAENDLGASAIYAETVLSAVHDAIEDLVEAISE